MKLLDRLRQTLWARHYSPRTEKAYVTWVRRFVLYHGKRHPAEMGEAEITAFLSALATRDRVSASTQNQALSAILFLYREALGGEMPWVDGVVRAKRPARLPVVLSREEALRLLGEMRGPPGSWRASSTAPDFGSGMGVAMALPGHATFHRS